MRWRAVRSDGTLNAEAPFYERIERTRPFSFEVYATTLDLLPMLKIPILAGDRLVYRRKRHSTDPRRADISIVAVESEDRSKATVWVFTPSDDLTTWQRLDGYSGEIYAPELLDFEDVVA